MSKSPYYRRKRHFTTSKPWRDQKPTNSQTESRPDDGLLHQTSAQLEHAARTARNRYGETLPENHLSRQEFDVYQRLYGAPIRIVPEQEQKQSEEAEAAILSADVGDGADMENALFRTTDSGKLEQVAYVQEEILHYEEAVQPDEEPEIRAPSDSDLDSQTPRQFPIQSETPLRFNASGDEEDASSEEATQASMWPGDEFTRTHPLTKSGRFSTYPSTLQLPQSALVHPVTHLLSSIHPKHLAEAAEKSLGGPGLPYSPSTPRISRAMEQKPIGLAAGQNVMKETEADAFLVGVMPQVYASVMATLVETRKRLGGEWLRMLLRKEGGPVILDAGGGGAGVLAWREVLRAEWETLHEEGGTKEENRKPAPRGRATVLTGSDALRHRASRLLENTTFLPRLPEFVDPTENSSTQTQDEVSGRETPNQPRKHYDLIIASHLLWPIKEDYARKTTVQTLWRLLNPNGGVLVILEKGVPRGFEVVAGARKLLLSKHISSPNDETFEANIDDVHAAEKGRYVAKESGMIIAPCTNHTKCPLYKIEGVSKGRKDWCYFSQRYTRPGYLQKVLGAKSRNFDNVEFSYLSVMRGRDHRRPEYDPQEVGFEQGEQATVKALQGHGPRLGVHRHFDPEDAAAVPSDDSILIANAENGHEREPGGAESAVDSITEIPPTTSAEAQDKLDSTGTSAPHMLTLPRTLLPPIKRKGHILLDVCTPSGTLERWVVNRRCGKQVYRDARKAQWGDLWALGAKSRTARRVRLGNGNVVEGKLNGKRRGKGKGIDGMGDLEDGLDELGLDEGVRDY